MGYCDGCNSNYSGMVCYPCYHKKQEAAKAQKAIAPCISGYEDINPDLVLSGEHITFLISTNPHYWQAAFRDDSGRLRAALPFKWKPCFGSKTPGQTWNAITSSITVREFFYALLSADPASATNILRNFRTKFLTPTHAVISPVFVGDLKNAKVVQICQSWLPLFSRYSFLQRLEATTGSESDLRNALFKHDDAKRIFHIMCDFNVRIQNLVAAARAEGFKVDDQLNVTAPTAKRSFSDLFHNDRSIEMAFGDTMLYGHWRKLAETLPCPGGKEGFSRKDILEFADMKKPWCEMLRRWRDFGSDIACEANLRAALKSALLFASLQKFDAWMCGEPERPFALFEDVQEPFQHAVQPVAQPALEQAEKALAAMRVACDEDAQDDGRMLAPFHGFENTEVLDSLEDALKSHLDTLDAQKRKTLVQKIEACEIAAMQQHERPPGMTDAMIAAIRLYTAPGDFYKNLNSALRNEKRAEGLAYRHYIVLLNRALEFIPFYTEPQVFRGLRVPAEKLNAAFREKGRTFTWNSFISTTSDVGVLENKEFLGKEGGRTMWTIVLDLKKPIARDIKNYSYFQSESELLIPPGTLFQVTSAADLGNGLTSIVCKQLRTANIFQ